MPAADASCPKNPLPTTDGQLAGPVRSFAKTKSPVVCRAYRCSLSSLRGGAGRPVAGTHFRVSTIDTFTLVSAPQQFIRLTHKPHVREGVCPPNDGGSYNL